jgi:hypothetical protein
MGLEVAHDFLFALLCKSHELILVFFVRLSQSAIVPQPMNKGAGCEMKFLLQEFAWRLLIPLRGKGNCDNS